MLVAVEFDSSTPVKSLVEELFGAAGFAPNNGPFFALFRLSVSDVDVGDDAFVLSLVAAPVCSLLLGAGGDCASELCDCWSFDGVIERRLLDRDAGSALSSSEEDAF